MHHNACILYDVFGDQGRFLISFWIHLSVEISAQILKCLSSMVHSFDKIHHTSLMYILELKIFSLDVLMVHFIYSFVLLEVAHVWAILLQNSDDL